MAKADREIDQNFVSGPLVRVGLALAGVALLVIGFTVKDDAAITALALVLGVSLILAGTFANRLDHIKIGPDSLDINLASIVQRREPEVSAGRVIDVANVLPEIDPVVPASPATTEGLPDSVEFSKVRPNTRVELTDSARGELANFYPSDARSILEGLLQLPVALETKEGVRLIQQPSNVAYYTYSPVPGVQVAFREDDTQEPGSHKKYVVLSILPQ